MKMASKGKKEFIYEGFTLPRVTIKEILASNARTDSELKTFHKQLEREKDELETDFSKTRSQLLSRALDHLMVLDGQSYISDSSSDDGRRGSEIDNSVNDHSTSRERIQSFSTLKDISSSHDAVGDDSYIRPSNRNPRQKQPWVEKLAHFEQLLAEKTEPVASKSQPKRKINWGGRANAYMENWDAGNEHVEHSFDTKTTQVAANSKLKRKISWGGRANVYMENWDARSELSKASSERNLSSGVARGDTSYPRVPRVRKHAAGERSRSFVNSALSSKNSGLTKEALQKHSTFTSKHLARRHTFCSKPRRDELSPTVEESFPEQKPLSDLLPPIKLPPIYLQETKSRTKGTTGDKHFNKHVKIGVSKSLDTKYSTQDLNYCRYLRIKRTDSEEYPW